MAQWEAALAEAKAQLLEATRANTDKLQAATQLMQHHKKLDAALVATQTRAGGVPSSLPAAALSACPASTAPRLPPGSIPLLQPLEATPWRSGSARWMSATGWWA